MKPIDWLPEPKSVRTSHAGYALPARRSLGISDGRLHPLARRLGPRLGVSSIAIAAESDPIVFRFDATLAPTHYRLRVTPQGVRLTAPDLAAMQNGAMTLLQLMQQCPDGRLPGLDIADWPDLAERGVYYDVTRGRVPKLERLEAQADLLADYKINHLQYYVEHTFRFRGHPLIGRGASPLTAEDMLHMDAVCADRQIDFVPSLASFGHLATVLRLPPYRHLAEDWAEGRYIDPQASQMDAWKRNIGWGLAPANPESYRFLDSLYAEYLPLFRSERFNACCDETWDMGMGQSYQMARRLGGKGFLYLKHVQKLSALAKRHGKQLMIWGDIIHHYPDLIPQLPRNLTVLDWGYDATTPFDRVAAFRKVGIPFLVCPGTSSWVSLFPRLHEAEASIRGYADAAHRHGAQGLLNTDWGDGGHYNFMEFSWHGYLLGAEQAWNRQADAASFTRRFARIFLGADDPQAVARAIATLGDITHTNVNGLYQSVWYHLFFAPPDSPLFQPQRRPAWRADRGRIRSSHVTLDRAFGERTLAQLDAVHRTLDGVRRTRGGDPHEVLPYWLFAIDTLRHAARRLTVLGPGGDSSRRRRMQLRDEMQALMARFQHLWLARSHRSEIQIVLKKYRASMQGYFSGIADE